MTPMGDTTVKVQATQAVLFQGQRFEAGETFEVPSSVAEHLTACGLAVAVPVSEKAPSRSTPQPIDSAPAGKPMKRRP